MLLYITMNVLFHDEMAIVNYMSHWFMYLNGNNRRMVNNNNKKCQKDLHWNSSSARIAVKFLKIILNYFLFVKQIKNR